MFIADLLGWWYSHGFSWAARELFVVSTGKITNFFSIGDLSKTLFAPFRQDSMQAKNAPIGVKLQLFMGNIISRIFGFMIRSTLIVFGLLALLFNFVVGAVLIVLWPLVPLMPAIAIICTVVGVGV